MKKLLIIIIGLFVYSINGFAQNKPRLNQLMPISISDLSVPEGTSGNMVITPNSDGSKFILQELPALKISETEIAKWNSVTNPFSTMTNLSLGQLLRYDGSSWVNWTPAFYLGTTSIALDRASGAQTLSGVSIGGNAATATKTEITDDVATSSAVYPTWVTASSGNLPQNITSTRLSFVPSTGTLTATNFSGDGSGLSNISASSFSGSLSGDVSGTQSSTSVGKIKGVAVPSLTTGLLKYDGSAWAFDNSSYITGNQSITFTPSGDVTGTATGTTSLTPILTIGADAITSSKIKNGEIVNADISSSAAISGTKVTPDFGDQDVSTNQTTTSVLGFVAGKDGLGQLGTLKLYDQDNGILTLSAPSDITSVNYTLRFPSKSATNGQYLQVVNTDDSDPLDVINELDWASVSSYSHPTGFTSKPSTVLSGSQVISQVQVNTEGHLTGVATRSLTASDIGALTSEVDGSTTNELQTLSVDAATNKVSLSNSGGDFTIAGAGINTVSTSGTTITVDGKEVDGDVTNEVQTLTATDPSPTVGANLNLSQAGGTGGGTVLLVGSGYTSVSYTDANTITINSTGDGVGGDSSSTNEAQTLSAGGTTSPTINLSSVSGTGGGTITLAATAPISLSRSSNTITIASSALKTAPNLQQVTDIGNTTTNAMLVNDMTIHGSLTGDNIRLGINKDAASTSQNLAPVGARNIAIGTESMKALMVAGDPIDDIGIGFNTLKSMISGNSNIAIGSYALQSTATADNNMAIGEGAFMVLDDPLSDDNIAIGFYAGSEKVNPKYTTVIGTRAFELGTGGEGNTSLGYYTLHKTTGDNNTAIGASALVENTTGTDNTALGAYVLQNSTYGNSNTGLGFKALNANTMGNTNTAVGAFSLFYNTMGEGNTAIGKDVLVSNTSGSYNTAVGEAAAAKTTIGSTTAIGYQALTENTSGTKNTAVGFQSLSKNTTASYNTALGYNALKNSVDGGYNTAIGNEALLSLVGGTTNTAIGNEALSSIGSTSSANTAIGSLAGVGVSGAMNTVYVGYAATGTGGNNEIVIGAGATGKGGNTISIGTSFVDLLYIANHEVFHHPITEGEAGTSGQILTSTGSTTSPMWRNLSLTGGGKISVTGSGVNWNVASTDPDEDPTNEIEKLQVDPTTGEISLVGADGNPLPVVDPDGNEVLGDDGKPLTSIIFSGLIFDSTTKTFKLPCPCDGSTAGIIKETSVEKTATDGQIDFKLDYVPATTSFVKMYINGVRISNSAYVVTDSNVTYKPESNGSTVLKSGDRIQFDYSYTPE